jgi:c(7)-type cytochrome triheme protein
MKRIPFSIAVLALIVCVGSAMAVPAGKTVDYDNSGGKVVFDGKVHADKGLKCNACHTKIFKMKTGAVKMTMADINAGKFCGACHNGTATFNTSDRQNCVRCHQK